MPDIFVRQKLPMVHQCSSRRSMMVHCSFASTTKAKQDHNEKQVPYSSNSELVRGWVKQDTSLSLTYAQGIIKCGLRKEMNR